MGKGVVSLGRGPLKNGFNVKLMKYHKYVQYFGSFVIPKKN